MKQAISRKERTLGPGLIGALVVAIALAPASHAAKGGGGGGGKPGGGGGGSGGSPAVAMTHDTSGGPLLLMDIDGGNQQQTVPSAEAPDWSADGARVVYGATGTAGQGLYTADLDGSGEAFVTGVEWLGDISPRWSPAAAPDGLGDREKIAFVDTVPGDLYLRFAVFVANLDGTGLQRLTLTGLESTLAAEDRHPTWSADATRLAFVRGYQEEVRHEVHVLSLVPATGGLAVASDDVLDFTGTDLEGAFFYGLDFAGGSDTLVVDARTPAIGNGRDLWTLDVDSPTNPWNLTETPTVNDGSPSWCEGDLQLTFATFNRRGKLSVHRIDADGRGSVDIGGAKKHQRYPRCK